jgi:peptidoglycan/LPS O-acetylase OafA/YrhL
MQRLAPIEGLRAYLAIWVLCSHVLEWSGYSATSLPGPLSFVRRGPLAVDVFMIVSGFVIFHLLRSQQQTYWQFIVRRFFRLFPAFLVFFIIAVAVQGIAVSNLHNYPHLPPDSRNELLLLENHLPTVTDTLLHLSMLHGLVPNVVIPHEPLLWLVPSWSVSLEWQFYLIAPFMFMCLVGAKPRQQTLACVGFVLLLIVRRRWLPAVDLDAALPLHIEHFFLGGVSYMFYSSISSGDQSNRNQSQIFVLAVAVAASLLVISRHGYQIVPICAWLIFLGLLLEPPTGRWGRAVLPLFNNPVAQFIGRISYSVYLCHWIVIILAQAALLHLWPGLPKPVHCLSLLAMTLAISVALSYASHTLIESPGIRLGRQLAARQTHQEAPGLQKILPKSAN